MPLGAANNSNLIYYMILALVLEPTHRKSVGCESDTCGSLVLPNPTATTCL